MKVIILVCDWQWNLVGHRPVDVDPVPSTPIEWDIITHRVGKELIGDMNIKNVHIGVLELGDDMPDIQEWVNSMREAHNLRTVNRTESWESTPDITLFYPAKSQ